MSVALTKTDFHFPGQKAVYHGKVRDVYNIGDEQLIMVISKLIRHKKMERFYQLARTYFSLFNK